MGILDKLGFFNSNQIGREELIKKKYLIKFCTIKELNSLWKVYMSRDNPTFRYKDDLGLQRTREPTRIELEQAMIDNIPLEGFVDNIPHLKLKLKRLEE